MTIELSLSQIQNGRIPFNMVLLRPAIDPSKISIGDGKVLFMDTEWNEVENIVRAFQVVRVPEKLVKKPNVMDQLVEMELQEGDLVCSRPLEALDNSDVNNIRIYVTDIKEILYLMPYSALVYAMRGNDPLPINGFNIVKPVYKESVKSVIIGAPKKKGMYDDKFEGEILHLAKPIKYHSITVDTPDGEAESVLYGDPEYDLKVGTKIILKGHPEIMEDPMHRMFFPDDVYLVRRKNILHVY